MISPAKVGREALMERLHEAARQFRALPKEEQDRQFEAQKAAYVAAEMAWGDEGTRASS